METIQVLETVNAGDSVIWMRAESALLREEQFEAAKEILQSAFDNVKATHYYDNNKIVWMCWMNATAASRRRN